MTVWVWLIIRLRGPSRTQRVCKALEATMPNGALHGGASMLERLINYSLTQRLLVCLAGLVLMCSGLYPLRHVIC